MFVVASDYLLRREEQRGVVLKLLACRTRGPGSTPFLAATISEIGNLLLPSHDMAEMLKTTNRQPILASRNFDVLHPISNNQLEFQLVSPSQETVGHCFDLFTRVVTKI